MLRGCGESLLQIVLPDKMKDRQNTVSEIQKYEKRKDINTLSKVISTFCLTKKLPTVYGLCKWHR